MALIYVSLGSILVILLYIFYNRLIYKLWWFNLFELQKINEIKALYIDTISEQKIQIEQLKFQVALLQDSLTTATTKLTKTEDTLLLVLTGENNV